ncbi:YecA family protein [Paenibacillus sp. YN15]|uniref:YecA family protein n=1 Tax=Paenibacillus sp. YN15 TaxID=1742774 RepID=UPI000DCCA16D|nr:SEC-C metal-binding domain-containing protein [Paenibacillus sp. YN15]RAV02677.1 hypothetical protein DQG13_09230 [Paenibacillus sp. YN15]
MIGRNDPCPCGSGKKYKQCCLMKQSEDQAEQIKVQRFFERKWKLTNDLHSFLDEKHGGGWMLDHQKMEPFDPSIDHFREGLGSVWAFFFRKYENGKRGIDWFLEEGGRRYSAEDREMLERWSAMKVSCYQIVGPYEQGVVIEDVWSGERYRMPYCETMVKLPPWSVAVGMIEPYFENWCIHGAFMWCGPDTKPAVMALVQQLQKEALQALGRELPPADIIADHYPDIINMCHRNNRNEKRVSSPKDTQEQVFLTRVYTCSNTELLAETLLQIEDEYLLAPGTDPAEGRIVISRAERLDHILDALPADRRAQLGLDDILIFNSLGNIEMDTKGVTVSGWWSNELEATLELLESRMASAVGLSRVNEHQETHRFPKGVILKETTILTEKDLSEQEIVAYSSLPQFLQWFQLEQEENPGETAETLVRRKEYEQYRINPNTSLKLLRVALGLPESPFVG